MSRTHRKSYFNILAVNTDSGRDKKPWYKPGRAFKTMEKRARKAKERNAIRSGDIIPLFRKTDVWNYT